MKNFIVLLLLCLNIWSNEINNEKNITPMDLFIKDNLYFKYANFIVNKDGVGNFDKLINGSNKILTTKESLVKGLYYYYYLNDKVNSLILLNKVYDKNLSFVKNNINGLYMQDIYIKEGKYNEAKKIISIEYCYSIEKDDQKNACLYNNYFLNYKLTGVVIFNYLFYDMLSMENQDLYNLLYDKKD